MNDLTRREAAKRITLGAAALMLPTSIARAANESPLMLTRAIPSSGEKLPVIGLGTWQTFDVELGASNEPQLSGVLQRMAQGGASLIDSSPMYGRSENVIGQITSKLALRDKLFLATKVWTQGKQAGMESMERSMTRFRTKKIDLMQVHNLVDVDTHLATMRDWKQQGRFRYIGVTHYNASALPEVEKVLRAEKVDFLQINYSVGEREAEQRVLPLAQERGVAVIINRPFGGGDLFRRLRSKPLPEWAAEFDCTSWAQFLLKWIIAHPAVTCAIPATDKPDHMEDNLRGGMGKMPDEKMRSRMVELVSKL